MPGSKYIGPKTSSESPGSTGSAFFIESSFAAVGSDPPEGMTQKEYVRSEESVLTKNILSISTV
jgi:hypothetical protein